MDFCENILSNFWARVHILKGKLRIFFRPPRVRNILKIKIFPKCIESKCRLRIKKKSYKKKWCILGTDIHVNVNSTNERYDVKLNVIPFYI